MGSDALAYATDQGTRGSRNFIKPALHFIIPTSLPCNLEACKYTSHAPAESQQTRGTPGDVELHILASRSDLAGRHARRDNFDGWAVRASGAGTCTLRSSSRWGTHLDSADERDVLSLYDLEVRRGGGDLGDAGELPLRDGGHTLAHDPGRTVALGFGRRWNAEVFQPSVE